MNQKQDPLWICCMGGGLASIITEFIYYPLDTLKTRLQASTRKVDYVKNNKKLSFFSGLSTTSIVAIPHGMTFFFVYENSKKYFSEIFNHGFQTHVISASIAEISVNLLRNPFEVVKQQMQIGLNKRIRDVIKNIYQIYGVSGFYNGYFPLIMREIPFSAAQFTIYEFLKSKTLERNQQLDFFNNSLNGALAGCISSAITNPIDVVKTKMMIQRQQKYVKTLECIKLIYLDDGIYGFLRGIHVRVPMISATGIIFFTSYEQSKYFIKQTTNFY